MKRAVLFLATLFVCSSAFAAPGADIAALKAYAAKALSRCPGSTVTVQQNDEQGPLGFIVYKVIVSSTDENCASQRYLLYSPLSQQVLIGTVITLPQNAQPLEKRVAESAQRILNRSLTASIAPFPLPDSLRAVSINEKTPWGPFAYHGYVDASQQYLMIGTRGNLRIDPRKTLRDSLGLENGVRRGNGVAKVEIIELSDFECPTCGFAHKTLEPFIAKNLSKISFIRLDLPLFQNHEWAMPAALGGHAIQKVAPSKYWQYVDYVFTNQEQIGKMPFEKVLRDWCEDHDIAWAKVAKIYTSQAERDAILAGVSRAFDNGVNATPTFIINGQMTAFGPKGQYVMDQIKAALK